MSVLLRSLADLKSLYEKVAAPKIPSPPNTPAPRRTQADLERDKRERQEEVQHRKALKEKDIPPYFESELGRAFLISNAAGWCGVIFPLLMFDNCSLLV